MRKLEALKVGGVQREEEKKNVLWVGKLIFFLIIFLILLFICTSKMNSRPRGRAPIAF